jgi:hypothetical protein
MSRSFRSLRHSRRYRPAQLRTFEQRSARRAVHQVLVDERRLAGEDPDWLEVLADYHEERGRLCLAQRLRRGRDARV